MENQEIGGAQALLLLGTKDKDDNPDELEKEQLLNDAVEAAVMQYVGGTLTDPNHDNNHDHHNHNHNHDSHDHNHDHEHHDSHNHTHNNPEEALHTHPDILPDDKRKLNEDFDYQWDRFLEEDVTDFDRSPKRRRRKSFGSGHDIDPELAGLDSSVEHDQLVHAAILGAGELAKQLALPPRLEEESVGAVGRAGGTGTVGTAGETDVGSSHPEGHAINQLAHAASALSAGMKRKSRRPLKKQAAPRLETPILPRLKYDTSSVEALVEQAAGEACMWYNSQADAGMGGPRLFSAEEIAIVEHFVDGYCQLHRLLRMDICRRVWSSERTKDSFWELVTKVLPYRSRALVYKHIRRQYHVFEIRARWTAEEDELLRKLAATCNTNWKKVGETMGRMPEDCRDRWRNYIKCGANRAANKWSEAEEQQLKTIVMEMLTHVTGDKPIQINWTVVLERMNGVRLRIQCRYKWNKLLRRELLLRIALMDSATKVWLLGRLLDANFADMDSIDWDYILHMYLEEHKTKTKELWTALDFKVALEKMSGAVRDRKSLPLHMVLTKLLSSFYEPEVRSKEFEPMRSISVEDQASSVANATVAAVSSGVTEQEAQHQEYSLWR